MDAHRNAARSGSSLAEALVAAALAGVALTGLAHVAGIARTGLDLARDTSTALALAASRLEMLRAGPRADGVDAQVGEDGTRFARTWRVTGGRGRPTRLSVEVAWDTHEVRLATEAHP